MIRNKMHPRSSRSLAVLLGLSLCVTVPVTTTQAAMLDNDQLAAQHQRDQQRADVQSLLARQEVAEYLRAQGVDPASIQGRVDALSDAELQRMHGQLSELPAGEGFLGAVIAIIVIFLLLDMGGVTDIFPRV